LGSRRLNRPNSTPGRRVFRRRGMKGRRVLKYALLDHVYLT
jgi:hypothetical protein